MLFRLNQCGQSARKAAFLMLLICALFSLPSHAYQLGDQVSEEVKTALSLDDEKLTIVDFFASWCTSCKKEIPLLDAMPLNAEKVTLLGVCTDKNLAKGKQFQSKLNIQFPVYNDTSQSVVAEFGPFGMPALYYLKGGKVLKVRFGALANIDKVVAADIDNLLKEHP